MDDRYDHRPVKFRLHNNQGHHFPWNIQLTFGVVIETDMVILIYFILNRRLSNFPITEIGSISFLEEKGTF